MDALLGPAPAIQSGLTDQVGVLDKKDHRRVLKELAEIRFVLPQIRVSIATLDGIPDQMTLPAYTFWLFNRTEIARKIDTDGRNYDILFTIDGKSRRAALMIGYGLEPLVGAHHLTRVLEAGHAHLVASSYAAGMITMIEALRVVLREIVAGYPAAFAMPSTPIAKAKTMAEAALEF